MTKYLLTFAAVPFAAAMLVIAAAALLILWPLIPFITCYYDRETEN